MEIKIRKIKKEDLKKLAKIYSITYSNPDYDIGEKWDNKTAYKMLKNIFEKQPDLAFLAEDNKKIIGGFLVSVKPWWDGNHLVDGEIFIHPKYQKTGIGTNLSKTMFNYAKKKYKVIKWDTFTFKDQYPLKWYKSLGFTEIKEWVMISADINEVINKLK